ncbi:MAG: hypothetical protein RSA41_08450 [Christensenella sp.]
MEAKDIKLSPKRGGNGYLSSFSVNFGISELKACGLVDSDGVPFPIEKIIDKGEKQIILRLKTED